MSNSRFSISNPALRGSLFYLTFFITVGVYLPYLNVYFLQLGLTGRQVGILSAIFPFGTLALATTISAFADRRRWRVQILQGSLVGVAIFLYLLGYPRTFSAIFGVMFVIAIFFSPVLAIGDSLIARMAERRKLNYGSMRLWGSIGFASSSALSGLLWARFGYQPMFLVGSLVFLPLIWIAGAQEEGPPTQEHERKPATDLLRDFGLMGIILATFTIGLALGLGLAFEGIYMDSLGGSEVLIGLLGTFQAFSELPTMRFGTAIARRLNGTKALLISYGLIGGAFLAYALVKSPGMLLFFAIFKGLGFGLLYTNTVRMVNLRAPAEWSATAQSLMTVGLFGLAPLIASPVGGIVLDAIGPAAIFIAASVAAGLGALVLVFTAARYKVT